MQQSEKANRGKDRIYNSNEKDKVPRNKSSKKYAGPICTEL